MEIIGKFIERVEKLYVDPKLLYVTVLRIFANLMILCWQNKCGGLFMILILSFIKSFKAKYFPSSIVIEAKATSRSYDWKNNL